MANNRLPSYNLANRESPAGIFSEILSEFSRNFECCLPAIVVSYNRATHEAVVQPAVNIILANGEQVQRAQVSATVWRFMCGGFLVDLPISAGDTGWLIASDRESTSVKTFGTTSPPQTYETHKYENGFFIPDKWGSVSLAGEDSGNMVFQNAAGTEKISIGASSTKITSAALTIVCPATTVTGDVNITGNVKVTGSQEITVDLKVNNVDSYTGHKHVSALPGNQTSAPITS